MSIGNETDGEFELMLNLCSYLDTTARDTPNKNAIIFGDQAVTFLELREKVDRMAAGLVKLGIKPGERIALMCPNVPWFPIAYYAILKSGAVVVPLNIMLKSAEIKYHLQDSGARILISYSGTEELPVGEHSQSAVSEIPQCSHLVLLPGPVRSSELPSGLPVDQIMCAEQIEETVARNGADTAVILYTSGTTGRPKGAELSHMNIAMNSAAIGKVFGLTIDDVQLLALPLFHTFGQTVQMNASIMVGATLVLMPRFEPELTLTIMQKYDVSVFCGVPTMFWGLSQVDDIQNKFDMDAIRERLRILVSGGASLPVELLEKVAGIFGVPVLEGYGLSETSPVVSFNRLDKTCKPGSVGLPLEGVEVKIVSQQGEVVAAGESGEILVRGYNIMKGYINRPEATAEAIENDWLHTGDMGRVDSDGYLYIVDRVKDMLIRGGYNVYPREIEEILMTHPAVSLVAVIGVACEKYGEEIKAYVIPEEGLELKESEIISWAKERMAAYKYPRIIEMTSSLPMTASYDRMQSLLR